MNLKNLNCWLSSVLASGLLALGSGVFANDAEVFVIAKDRIFQQTDASGPHAVPDEYLFFGVVLASESGSIVSASITHPDQSTIALRDGGEEWFFEEEFTNANGLHSQFPNGVYTFHITGVNDGAKTIPLNLSGDYLDPVLISNYNALQAVDPSQELTIQWTAPQGSSADDFILIYVEGCNDDDVISSPLPWEDGGLNGHATQFTIAASELNPGTVYNVQIEYFRVVD